MAVNISQKDHWTVERIDVMKWLYASGAPASLIAAELNEMTDSEFTRNAVIGKVHREKLELRGKTWNNREAKSKKTRVPRKPSVSIHAARWGAIDPAALPPIGLEEIRLADVVPRHVSLLELQCNECRYPYGDCDFTFCGHKTDGASYCRPHTALTTKPQHHLRGRPSNNPSWVTMCRRSSNAPTYAILNAVLLNPEDEPA